MGEREELLKAKIERLRNNDFAGMETMRTFALDIIADMYTPAQGPLGPANEFVERLRTRAKFAREEGSMTAKVDATFFDRSADEIERLSSAALRAPEACEYCGDGKRTGLPGNACENCMNTGLKHPERAPEAADAGAVAWRCFDKALKSWVITDSAELVEARRRYPEYWYIVPLYVSPTDAGMQRPDPDAWFPKYEAVLDQAREIADGAAIPSTDGNTLTIPLSDHDEIGRLVLDQPWAIQSAIVTIAAHCTALVDKCPTGDVADLAGCISENCMALAKALALAPHKCGGTTP